jgi:hypothetical protein
MEQSLTKTSLSQAMRATSGISSDPTKPGYSTENPLIDCEFRVFPEILGPARLSKTLAAFRTYDLQRFLGGPDSLDPRTWLRRWEKLGDNGSDPLLNPGSRRLARQLHAAATVALADGLNQLNRLVGSTASPEVAEEISRYAGCVERCYAVALRTLQGVARTNRCFHKLAESDLERGLLVESADVMVDHARWAGASVEDAQGAACCLGEKLCRVLSRNEEAAFVNLTDRLESGLETLWQLISMRRANMPADAAKNYLSRKIQPLLALRNSLGQSGVLVVDPQIFGPGMVLYDEMQEAILEQARLMKRCCDLLSQERNLDLIGIPVNDDTRASYQRRLNNCYDDFFCSKGALLRELRFFDAPAECISAVERDLGLIEFSLDCFSRASREMLARIRNGGRI